MKGGERTTSQLKTRNSQYHYRITEAEPTAEVERSNSDGGSPGNYNNGDQIDEFGKSNMMGMEKSKFTSGSGTKKATLNKGARVNEMKRIMQDNEFMLKRLQDRTSTYNVFAWENDRKQQVRTLRRISKYDLSIPARS